MTLRRPFARFAPILGLILTLATGGMPRPAAAAWPELDGLPLFTPGAGGIGGVCSDGRGGLITTDGTRVGRLNRNGAQTWSAGAGTTLSFNPSVLVADGHAGAWCAAIVDDDLIAQHLAPDGTTTIAAPDETIETGVVGPVFAAAATTSGDLVVAYWRVDGLYVQRVAPDGDGEFASPGVRITTDTLSSTLQLHGAGEGAVAVWSSSRIALPGSTGPFRIVANKINGSGVVQWGAEGSVVQASNTFAATRHRSAFDGTSLFVCWMSFVNPDRVRAQRLDASGAVQWGTSFTGITVYTYPDSGTVMDPNPQIACDGNGGCVVAWEEGRIDSVDLFAQWIDASGTPLGAANGYSLVSGSYDQDRLAMVPDDAGGVWFIFHTASFSGQFHNVNVFRHTAPGQFSSGANPTGWVGTNGSAEAHRIAPDGAGGVVGVFQSPSSGGARGFHYGPNGQAYVPVFTLDAPNAGGAFASSRIVPITWTSNLGGHVRLEYGSGGLHSTIDAEDPDDGSFNWSVPPIASPAVRVHLSLGGEPSLADSSNATFSVCTSLSAPAAHSVAPVATPNAPRDLVAADFDGDGDPDLAVAVSAGVAIKIGDGAGGFAAPAFYATPSAASGIASGDFDDDGDLDLAVAHATGVSVLRGNQTAGVPNGTFAAATAVAGFTNGADVLALDLNADGILDLAASDSSANRVGIALGQGAGGLGNGTFAAAALSSTGASGLQPEQLAAGDFNGDGAVDLAVTANQSDRVVVFLGGLSGGLPTGVPGAPVPYACGADPRGLATGDFDEDGALDLAVVRTGEATSVAILRGTTSSGVPTGAFAAAVPVTGSLPPAQDVAMGDFDEDGIADLVVSNLSGFIQLLFGNGVAGTGNGTFVAGGALVTSVAPMQIALSDFNGDQKPDVAVSNGGSFTVSVAVSGCAASGSAVTVAAPGTSSVAYLGDRERLTWTRGANVQTVDVEVRRAAAVWKRVAQDLPANQFDWRVVVPEFANSQVRVRDSGVPTRVGTSPGAFAVCDMVVPQALETTASAGPKALASVDVDEDGIFDLAYLTNNDLGIKLGVGAAGVGTGDFANAESVFDLGAGLLANALRMADLGHDGIVDAVVATSTGLRVAPGLGTGGVANGTFGATLPHGPATSLRDLVVADFDENGIPDVAAVGGNPALDTLYVYLGLGADGAPSGAFAPPARVFVGPSATDVLAHDFDEDGILDLAVTNASVSVPAFAVLLGQGTAGHGTGAFDPPVRHTTIVPNGLTVADLDRDGIADLVGWSGATVFWNRGLGASTLGNGTFAPVASLSIGLGIRDVRVADATRDGLPDLVVARDGTLRELSVYPGRSVAAPVYDAAIVTIDPQAPAAIALTDQNEDDRLDVLVGHDSADLRNYAGECSDAPGALTLVAGLTGQSFSPGSEKTISWTRSPDVTHVDVEYSRDGTNWRTIARAVTEESFRWTVPPPVGTARVRVVDANVLTRVATGGTFTIVPGTVDGDATRPVVVAFGIPSPNPSRGRVTFALDLPQAAAASVELFDVGGRHVRSLVAGTLPAGRHTLAWDGRDDAGREVAAGVLFARARVGERRFVRTVVRAR